MTQRECDTAMRPIEIELAGVQPLYFRGERIGTVERRETRDRPDSLAIHFETGTNRVLPAAVDVSEQLSTPRVFIIEGRSPDTFMLFGGERLYWVSPDGDTRSEKLFRERGWEEYWTTEIIEQQRAAIIIYESGVIMIDEALQVRWHARKYFNDSFIAVEGSVLRFRQDGQDEWSIRIEDGMNPDAG